MSDPSGASSVFEHNPNKRNNNTFSTNGCIGPSGTRANGTHGTKTATFEAKETLKPIGTPEPL